MKNVFWIVSGFIIASVLLTRWCTSTKTEIKETVVTKSDTVWLKPDTVIKEIVVTEVKTVVKTKSIPAPSLDSSNSLDSAVYVYDKVNFFGDTVAVIDTITVHQNQIVEHRQRVVLLDVQKVVEKVVEIPVVIRDTVEVTKEITKTVPDIFNPSAYAGVTYLNYGNKTGIAPNAGYRFGRHYVGIGAIFTLNQGLNGGLFEYKFRFK